MAKFEMIHLSDAEEMSYNKLETEIGKRAKYLREECGVDREEIDNIFASLMNIAQVMNDKRPDKD